MRNNTTLWISSDGSLYREQFPHETAVVRENYARHHRDITDTLELRSSLRAGEYAWPGGCELFAVTADGAVLCFECVRANYASISRAIRTHGCDGWRVVALGTTVNCEESTYCDHCNRVIYDYES